MPTTTKRTVGIKIEDVPMWLPLRGIGHAVAHTHSGWHFTACGTYTPNGPPTPERPARICSKCRERLKAVVTAVGELTPKKSEG